MFGRDLKEEGGEYKSGSMIFGDATDAFAEGDVIVPYAIGATPIKVD
jgi:hypothetical protein